MLNNLLFSWLYKKRYILLIITLLLYAVFLYFLEQDTITSTTSITTTAKDVNIASNTEIASEITLTGFKKEIGITTLYTTTAARFKAWDDFEKKYSGQKITWEIKVTNVIGKLPNLELLFAEGDLGITFSDGKCLLDKDSNEVALQLYRGDTIVMQGIIYTALPLVISPCKIIDKR